MVEQLETEKSRERVENLEDIKRQLDELGDLIVMETLESLENLFVQNKEDEFKEKIERAKFFKDGLILQRFLSVLDERYSDLTQKEEYKHLYDYLKEVLEG